MIGTRLGHYRVLARLGQGGMGVVYRAHDEVLQRDVAIKLVQPDAESDPRARARLLREARMASALQDSHICTVFEVAEEGTQSFIVMELLHGRTLAEMVRAGPLEFSALCRVGSQISGALAHAHARGVVHRDLKCANVMVGDDGDVKVLDFGLARRHIAEPTEATQSMTMTAGMAGTPAYMAPETLLGREPDAASDLWSLGVVLHEMAAGSLPFPGGTVYELSTAILNTPPRRLPETVPAPLRALIDRCLEKNPAHRIESAGAVRSALEAIASGSAATVRVRPPTRPLRVAIGAAAGVLATLLAAWWLIGHSAGLAGGSHSSRTIRSLAVLPLENLTGDPQQEYFADGMTDELINTLARLAALRVISRTSVMQYRGTHKRVRDIAHELGVDAVIEGAVARGGDQVRISAMLIRGDNDQNLWANEYQRKLSDVLALQCDVASAVAQQVQITLTPAEQATVTRHRAVNPQAYEALLRGRHALDAQSLESTRAARTYMLQAIAIDPAMASAYASLAICCEFSADIEGDQKKYLEMARAAAIKSIDLDESLPEGHTALGRILAEWDYDWDGADQEYRRAIALDPSNAEAHLWRSIELRCRGDVNGDRKETRLAIALDPLNRYATAQPGWTEFWARRYDVAVRTFQAELAADSTLVQAHEGLGLAYQQLHRDEDAIGELSRAVRLLPDPAYFASLGHALAAVGRTREAEEILARLNSPRPDFIAGAGDRALVELGLGRTQDALRDLSAGVEDHSPWIDIIRADPRLDPVRGAPEFERALERMHLSDRDLARSAALHSHNSS